jgi:hypothetical protein
MTKKHHKEPSNHNVNEPMSHTTFYSVYSESPSLPTPTDNDGDSDSPAGNAPDNDGNNENPTNPS